MPPKPLACYHRIMSSTRATGELKTALNLTTGERLFQMTIHIDRRPKSGGGLTKGTPTPSLIQTSLANLFYDLHMICNQNGIETIEDLGRWMKGGYDDVSG